MILHNRRVAGVAYGDGLGVMQCELDNPFYPMHHNPRGKCIIINLENFHASQNLASRPGSTVDADNFRECIQELHFEVIEISDEACTYKNIFSVLCSGLLVESAVQGSC